MIRVWICDDNKKMALLITEFVKRFFYVRNIRYLIDTYFSGTEVVDTLEKENNAPDVLLLAIKMKKISGYKVAGMLKKLHCRTLLIFISAYSELFYESLKFMPFGYINKKYMQNEIDYFLRKAELMINSYENMFLYIDKSNNSSSLREKDIIYIESRNKKSYVNMSDGQVWTVRRSLSFIYEKIEKELFFKVSRSILVNARHVRGYCRDLIILKQGNIFKLSRSNSQTVRKDIENYFINDYV